MSLIYNGTTIENAIYNGTTLEKIIFNGTEVFSAGFTLNITISSNTTNYNIASAATALGWDGVKKLKGTITINSGVYVYSTSTGTPAFSTGTMPSGSDVTVVNNGTILGRGGSGGNGGICYHGPYDGTNWSTWYGNPGSSGGLGLYATSAIKVTNNGRISGGGGGGGGGAGGGNYSWSGPVPYSTGGGGGIGNGSGGSSQCNAAGNGGSGTLTSGGSGGTGQHLYFSIQEEGMTFWLTAYTGPGGTGGSYGSAGTTGGGAAHTVGTFPPWPDPFQFLGGSGGAGGAAVVGTSNITWNATGTRNGAIS